MARKTKPIFQQCLTQPTISQNFSGGKDIGDLIEGLRSGKIHVSDVPVIRVVESEGRLFTLDNRRLAAFQNAKIEEIPIRRVSLEDPAILFEFKLKYNPIENGSKTVVIPKSSMRDEMEQTLRDYGKIK
jgi:hypothetical protein